MRPSLYLRLACTHSMTARDFSFGDESRCKLAAWADLRTASSTSPVVWKGGHLTGNVRGVLARFRRWPVKSYLAFSALALSPRAENSAGNGTKGHWLLSRRRRRLPRAGSAPARRGTGGAGAFAARPPCPQNQLIRGRACRCAHHDARAWLSCNTAGLSLTSIGQSVRWKRVGRGGRGGCASADSQVGGDGCIGRGATLLGAPRVLENGLNCGGRQLAAEGLRIHAPHRCRRMGA